MIAGTGACPSPSKLALIRAVYHLAVGASPDSSRQVDRPETQLGAALLIGAIIDLALLRCVIPRFAVIFATHNARLPLITQCVLDASWAVSRTAVFVACLLLARLAAASLNYLVRSPVLTENRTMKRGIGEALVVVAFGTVTGLSVVSMYLPLFKVSHCLVR